MDFEDLDFARLDEILASGTKAELDEFLTQNQLEIKDGKIVGKNKELVDKSIAFWDKRQLVRKISLNSLYGALLNEHCRFFDKRIGQSTTLTGRAIAKHMDAYVNECLTSEYDHAGDAIVYGDSVTGDTQIDLEDNSRISIEDLFNNIQYKVIQDNGKEYAIPRDTEMDLAVLGYNSHEDEAVFGEINFVMRHKTSKQLYKVTMEDGTHVTVTEDHSIIVDRDGFTTEVKPTELEENDLIISLA